MVGSPLLRKLEPGAAAVRLSRAGPASTGQCGAFTGFTAELQRGEEPQTPAQHRQPWEMAEPEVVAEAVMM